MMKLLAKSQQKKKQQQLSNQLTHTISTASHHFDAGLFLFGVS